MSLERIYQLFKESGRDEEDIQELLSDEIADMLEDYNRAEILELAEDFSNEFQEMVEDVLDYEILQVFDEQLRSDEDFDDTLDTALDQLLQDYSREQILSEASSISTTLREEIEGRLPE